MGGWVNGSTPPPPATLPTVSPIDLWDTSTADSYSVTNALPETYLCSGGTPTRPADDVVLNNVIGFDVEVWENSAGTFVNMPNSYDTGCWSYENEGIYNFNASGNPVTVPPTSKNYPAGLGKWPAGTSTNGMDDDGNGIVDDASELITQPPYPVPLRGIQIKIRCYEPDSHQVIEKTLVHDFLPK